MDNILVTLMGLPGCYLGPAGGPAAHLGKARVLTWWAVSRVSGWDMQKRKTLAPESEAHHGCASRADWQTRSTLYENATLPPQAPMGATERVSHRIKSSTASVPGANTCSE